MRGVWWCAGVFAVKQNSSGAQVGKKKKAYNKRRVPVLDGCRFETFPLFVLHHETALK